MNTDITTCTSPTPSTKKKAHAPDRYHNSPVTPHACHFVWPCTAVHSSHTRTSGVKKDVTALPLAERQSSDSKAVVV